MIGEILRQHGYTQDRQQPFIFRKLVRGQVGWVRSFVGGFIGRVGRWAAGCGPSQLRLSVTLAPAAKVT